MPFLINGALFSFDISLNAFMPNHMMAPDKKKYVTLPTHPEKKYTFD
jgi:hypothetical protein